MGTQLYTYRSDRVFRLLAKQGLGALVFSKSEFAALAPEHEHPESQISILFGGHTPSLLAHHSSGTTTRSRVSSGSYIYVPPGQPHRLNWQKAGSLVNLYLSDVYLQQLADASDFDTSSLRLLNRPDQGIYQVARFLLEEHSETDGLSIATIDHATALIASRIARASGQMRATPSRGLLSRARIQPAVDFISSAPEADFDLVFLSRLCRASVFHFARSFSACVGMPPFEFQRAKRLEKARALLTSSDLSVSAIAGVVGMKDSAHFARSFRRDIGISPSQYRATRNRDLKR